MRKIIFVAVIVIVQRVFFIIIFGMYVQIFFFFWYLAADWNSVDNNMFYLCVLFSYCWSIGMFWLKNQQQHQQPDNQPGKTEFFFVVVFSLFVFNAFFTVYMSSSIKIHHHWMVVTYVFFVLFYFANIYIFLLFCILQ